jgi:hypothetical protein
MKHQVTFTTIVLLGLFYVSCSKKNCPNIIEPAPLIADTITFYKTDRHDVPPPPTIPWRLIDTTKFSTCEHIMWKYLKNMYPIRDSNYWDYNIYAIQHEPESFADRRKNESMYIYFFLDTVSSKMIFKDQTQPCANVDTTFFLQTIGPPTCRSFNHGSKEIAYFYYFKLRDRHGPCAYIYDIGHEFEHKCNTYHFQYCAGMRIIFSPNQGRMSNVFFWGSS